MTTPIPMPACFPAVASEQSIRALSARYNVCRETVMRWRKEISAVTRERPAWTPDEDAYLRTHYGTMGFTDIGSKLNRSAHACKSRAQKLGIQSPRKQGWNLQPRTAGTKIAAGHSGEAAYLQAYGPIYRCHSDGTPAPIGAYWYWAGQVLTHDEMEAKARSHRERRALLDMAA